MTSEEFATAQEVREWEAKHDEPHPVFRVPHRPERHQIEFDYSSDEETDEDHS